MVALNDLATAGFMVEELTRYQQAISALERNAPITALTVGSVTVRIREMPYPEQMGQAVVAALNARAQELQHELEQLGVTDLEPLGPRAAPAEVAQPEAAPAPPPRQPPPSMRPGPRRR